MRTNHASTPRALILRLSLAMLLVSVSCTQGQPTPKMGLAGSFMAGRNVKEATRSEAIAWWQYGELLFWDNPPAGYREFIAYRDGRSRPYVFAFYLPPGADPYKDSHRTLYAKGAFESTRWYAPRGDPGDDALDPDALFEAADPTYKRDPNHPLPLGYRRITVRGEQAKLSEMRTDCHAGNKCEDWQAGSNVDERKILVTRRDGAGFVQWATLGHWKSRTADEQIQITEALTPYKR